MQEKIFEGVLNDQRPEGIFYKNKGGGVVYFVEIGYFYRRQKISQTIQNYISSSNRYWQVSVLVVKNRIKEIEF